MDFFKKFGICTPRFNHSFYGVGDQYVWLPKEEQDEKDFDLSKKETLSVLESIASKNYMDWHFMKYARDPEYIKVSQDLIESKFMSFDEVVLLGTGGSSLGAKALYELQVCKGLLDKKIHFFDNVDPQAFEVFAKRKDLGNIGVLVITKSGGTPETLAQLTYLIDLWQKVQSKEAISKQFLCITEDKNSPIVRLAEMFDIECLPHDFNLGGRFSVVSKVGLLPFSLAGGSSDYFQQGLQQVIQFLKTPENLPAVLFIAAHNFLEKKKKIQEIILSIYGDAWRYVPAWFMQLWAESLGKRGKGTMPIGSLGTQDQHSLLQLFLDGPQNKFFTVIISKDYGDAAILLPQDRDLEYLKGKTLGDLMVAEAWATVRTLVEKGCPVRVLHLNNLGEKSLGAFMLNCMLETALQAGIWGIDAFDQPAVEKGKILTKKYLRG